MLLVGISQERSSVTLSEEGYAIRILESIVVVSLLANSLNKAVGKDAPEILGEKLAPKFLGTIHQSLKFF